MSKIKAILDLGLGVVSKRVYNKQEEKHKKIIDENKRKFMIAWEDKYGKGIKGRRPLDFFEGDKDEKLS